MFRVREEFLGNAGAGARTPIPLLARVLTAEGSVFTANTTLTVLEPKLEYTLTDSNPAPAVRPDAGDTVNYRFQLQHTANSDAPAYGVSESGGEML